MGGAAADPARIFSLRVPHRDGRNSSTPHRLGIVTRTDFHANLCLPGPRISGQAPATDLLSSSKEEQKPGPGPRATTFEDPPAPTPLP